MHVVSLQGMHSATGLERRHGSPAKRPQLPLRLQPPACLQPPPLPGRGLCALCGVQQLFVQRDSAGHAGGRRLAGTGRRCNRGAAHRLLLLC